MLAWRKTSLALDANQLVIRSCVWWRSGMHCRSPLETLAARWAWRVRRKFNSPFLSFFLSFVTLLAASRTSALRTSHHHCRCGKFHFGHRGSLRGLETPKTSRFVPKKWILDIFQGDKCGICVIYFSLVSTSICYKIEFWG